MLSKTSITASVRLEKLTVATDIPKTDNVVQGRVIERTFLGSRLQLELLVESADDECLRVCVDSEHPMPADDALLWIGWDAADMSVLRD